MTDLATPEKPLKRPLTPAQLEQRRAAALNSTGPKTDQGKARSSRNAWKHGLTSAASKMAFQQGAASMASLFGKPCLTTCPMHPDNPERSMPPCGLVTDGMTSAGGNCLDKTVYVHAYAAILDGMQGAMEGMHQMLAAEGAAALQLVHQLRSQLTTDGIAIPQYAVDKEGRVVMDPENPGRKLVIGMQVNPLWGVLLGMIDKLGISLPEMLATPAARSRAKLNEDAADAMTSVLGAIMQRANGHRGLPGD